MPENTDRIDKLEGKVTRLKEGISQRDLKLKSILDLTDAINSNVSTEELIERFANTVKNDLRITKLLFLALFDGTWTELLSIGAANSISPEAYVSEFAGMNRFESIESSPKSIFNGWSLFIPVLHEEKPLAYVLIGDNDEDGLGTSPIIKHMRLVQTLSNIISVAIQNKTLYEKSLEQERIKAELTLAAQMQSMMVSTEKVDAKYLQVATYYKPHQQVGGDFYDFINIDEDRCFFCIADVSGKGVSAAFLMANIQAHIKAILNYADLNLEMLAYELNSIVNDTARGDRFVTIFLGTYNSKTRTLEYINAGHNPPVLLNGSDLHLLENGTVGMGMLESLPFVNAGKIEVLENAYLACYTDGVVEMENEVEEEFGTAKVGEAMLSVSKKSLAAEKLVSEIVRRLDSHRGSIPYFDDTALLCVRFF